MGIFNEQSYNHPFARGIQGAPGVGFSLTADGNYDMTDKKLTNVGSPTSISDAATKKYVDDNSSGRPKTSRLPVDSDVDMKDTYRILNLKAPSDADEPATENYIDSNFLNLGGGTVMKTFLDMGNQPIYRLRDPVNGLQGANKRYVERKTTTKADKTELNDYIKKDGSTAMTGDFKIAGHKILNLRTPISNSEPATKKYVDINFLKLQL